ncbi:MAG: hypothetical protein WDM90_18550 [Ferruginibacter sp.]
MASFFGRTSFSVLSNSFIGIAHWDNPNWGNCSGTGDNASNFAVRSGYNIIFSFAVGKTPFVLPIKFEYVNALKGNGYNTITWKQLCTGTEQAYVVERSTDGRNFTSINSIAPSPNGCTQPFSYVDNTASNMLFITA